MRNVWRDDVAKRLHVVRQTVSKWENDLSKPDDTQIRQLAKLFEVDEEWLAEQINIARDDVEESDKVNVSDEELINVVKEIQYTVEKDLDRRKSLIRLYWIVFISLVVIAVIIFAILFINNYRSPRLESSITNGTKVIKYYEDNEGDIS